MTEEMRERQRSLASMLAELLQNRVSTMEEQREYQNHHVSKTAGPLHALQCRASMMVGLLVARKSRGSMWAGRRERQYRHASKMVDLLRAQRTRVSKRAGLLRALQSHASRRVGLLHVSMKVDQHEHRIQMDRVSKT